MSEKIKIFISKFKQSNFNIFAKRRRHYIMSPVESSSEFFQRNKHFQKKKILIMAVAVLFIAVSVSIPIHQAQANFVTDAFMNIIGAFAEKGLGGVLGELLYAIIVAILSIGLDLSIILVKFGAWLIDTMLDPRLYVGDTSVTPNVPGVLTSSTITVGWTTVRDMCNTFYVFFLLIIAFGTILRSSTYNAKNLLPKLIISLFLINFSAVIAKLVIDFGQVFMYGIMSWMGNFGESGGSLTSIVDLFRNEVNWVWQADFEQVVKAAFALSYSVALGLIYIMLAGFLLVRLVAFVFLIILSPIAFLSIVIPSLGKYTSEWWSELVKYSLFGPIFIFFIYLSATMANELVINFKPIPPALDSDLNTITSILMVMVPHSVALIMLLAVIPITQRLGVAGANKIIGGRLGLGNIVMGGYAGAKKTFGLGKRVGGEITSRSDRASKAVDSAKSGFYNKIAVLPGMKGYAMRGKMGIEKSREEKMKKLEVEFGDLKSIDLNLLESKAKGTLGTTNDKALLLKVATAQNKLGEKDKDGNLKYVKYLPGAETSLSKKELSAITDKSLVLATMTKEGKKKISEANSGNYENFSDETAEKIKTKKITAEEGVMRDKMADIIRDGKAHEVNDLNNKMSAKIWDDAQDSDQKKSSINRMAKDQRNQLAKGYMENTMDTISYSNRATMARVGRPDQKADAKKALEKDAEFKINAVNLGQDLEETFKKGGGDFKKDIENVFGKFDAKVVGKFNDEQLKEYGHKTTASQWRGLDRSNKTAQYNIVLESKERRRSTTGISIEEEKKLKTQIEKMEGLLTGENR